MRDFAGFTESYKSQQIIKYKWFTVCDWVDSDRQNFIE